MKYRMLAFAMLSAAALVASAQSEPAAPGPGPAPATSTAPRLTGTAAEVDPVITAFLQPIEAAPGDDALRQKLKERHNTAVRLLQLRLDAYHHGTSDVGAVFDASRMVADAKMALAPNAQEREAVARHVLDVTRLAETRLEQQWRSGFGSEASLLRARLAREDAEVALLQLTRGGGEGATTQPANATQPR